jgi:hypothetical protein
MVIDILPIQIRLHKRTAPQRENEWKEYHSKVQ